MTDEIKPALTPEEWTQGKVDRPVHGQRAGLELNHGIDADGVPQVMISNNTIEDDSYHSERSRHAIAAFCLYGQPFGFTHEDVKALREAADYAWADICFRRIDYMIEARPRGESPLMDRLDSIVARIAALLPPEEKGA